ncbi:MAG: hypothetical protein IAI48_02850 [Candidatus Eremiobacteraeota bacterium]|nr:hypothetical protein [Candidatus Eremiobacteraeota bacterium]
MLILKKLRRFTDASMFAIGAIVVVCAAFLAATNRAGAASIVRAVTTAITCSSTGTSSCFDVTNTSSGVAVYGTSKSGTGLRGASTSNYGIKGTSSSSEGVFAQSTTGTAAIEGTMTDGIGVYGVTTGNPNNPYDDPGIGVYGYTPGNGGYGGIGVSGKSDTGTGVLGTSTSGFAGLFTGGTFGLVGRSMASAADGGQPLQAENADGSAVFVVDSSGNVSYQGMLNPFVRTRGEASAKAYGVEMAAPTMEDTGTAQLIRGESSVRLDPTFAAAIDTTTPYRVFITPAGDSRGLYVASRSLAGFIVRESQGGRSTMSFDYRIVASPLAHARERMTMVSRAELAAESARRMRPRSKP